MAAAYCIWLFVSDADKRSAVLMTARLAWTMLSVVGVDAQLLGADIVVPTGRFTVNLSCTGIVSIWVGCSIAIGIGRMSKKSLALVLIGIPLGVALNTVRLSTVIGVAASDWKAGLVVHDVFWPVMTGIWFAVWLKCCLRFVAGSQRIVALGDAR